MEDELACAIVTHMDRESSTVTLHVAIHPALRGIFVYDQPGHYTFFHGDDTLHDAILGIDLPLTTIFE